jgi:hypothetical protein
MIIETRTGKGFGSKGTTNPARASNDLSITVAESRGRFAEGAINQELFQGFTAAAGSTVAAANISPVAAAAASLISLYNPISSGITAEVLKAFINSISGTPGVGGFVYNIAFNQIITAIQNNGGVTGNIPLCTYLGNRASACKIFVQLALTGSGVQVLGRPLPFAPFAGAITATSPGLVCYDPLEGEIILPPGGLLTIAPTATGTSHVVNAGFVWQEKESATPTG